MRIIQLFTFIILLLVPVATVYANPEVTEYEVGNKNIHVFMYHEIGHGPNNLYVPEDEFELQMRMLSENSYKTATVSQIPDILAGRLGDEDDRWVLLTFDDGYVSFYEKAFPILKKYNLKGTVFIITDMVDTPNHMTWRQLESIQSDGIEIASHTKTHPYLTSLTKENQEIEILNSKRKLEQILNNRVISFSYPYGSYNQEVKERVKHAGYSTAVTVVPGIASSEDDPLLIPRINVYGGISQNSLESILSLRKGQFDNNMAKIFEAIDVNPKDSIAYLNRGMAYHYLGVNDKAIADCNESIELDPSRPEPYNGRGWIYNELGQYEQAIKDYSKSIELAPEFSYPYNNRGAAYIRLGLYQKAIEDCNKVIEMDPSFPYLASTYSKRGYAHAKLGLYAEAIDDLNKSIEMDPNNPTVYYNIYTVLVQMDQKQKGLYYLERALELELKA
ncbi:hypothetical protein N752_04260 [Desulforamulus aquiferis]|nr:polysaccharide deacetylase family protein [Desulforamulus aquiferis]RYD06382.1 hypothetical protein N752_04260 [Desulforamulus aquiferis]